MGSLYAKDVISTALNEVGYIAEGSNHKYTIYSAELDAVDYFNTKKNGVADWCAIFICWCMYANTRNANGEIDADKYDAQFFQYQPDHNACAGVGYMADCYQQNDAWFSDTSEIERGDIVTFRDYAHVGLIVDWDESGFTTVEGNVGGDGEVDKRWYRYDDSRIDGFGRPRYDGWEFVKESPKESDKKEPETITIKITVTTDNADAVKSALKGAKITVD
jgi:hypothetical protein